MYRAVHVIIIKTSAANVHKIILLCLVYFLVKRQWLNSWLKITTVPGQKGGN